MTNKFIEWARANGWNIISADEEISLPESISKRYEIPAEWYSFINKFRKCENSAATVWFLTPDDYLPQDGFQWNEFELQSLEYADPDDDIVSFWDRHLPVVISVEDGYSYYAIDTQTGNVVNGYEPEYEDASVIAEDFDAFITKIISGEIVL